MPGEVSPGRGGASAVFRVQPRISEDSRSLCDKYVESSSEVLVKDKKVLVKDKRPCVFGKMLPSCACESG